MNNNDEKVMKALVFVLDLATFAGRPFVLLTLWRWFAVPLGMVPVTYGQALGLLFLLGFLRARWNPPLSVEDELKRSAFNAFNVPFALACGWLVMKVSA